MIALELTLEEKFERVRHYRPIDDVFFEVLAASKPVCQEMLRTILEDPGLIVLDVVVQSSERNLYGRSVRLDALCTLGDGRRVNIEVQRSDNDDHLRRIRMNASDITTRESQCGEAFSDIPELIIIYLSEFDFLGEGRTTYHIDKVIRESGTIVRDGLSIICVNAAVYDGTEIAELMRCFLQETVEHPTFPALSQEVHKLKETEGGASAVCEIMKHYEDIARAEGINIGRSEGINIGRSEGINIGRSEGINIGRRDLLWSLVRQGLLPVDAAAAQAGLSVEAFLQTKPRE